MATRSQLRSIPTLGQSGTTPNFVNHLQKYLLPIARIKSRRPLSARIINAYSFLTGDSSFLHILSLFSSSKKQKNVARSALSHILEGSKRDALFGSVGRGSSGGTTGLRWSRPQGKAPHWENLPRPRQPKRLGDHRGLRGRLLADPICSRPARRARGH